MDKNGFTLFDKIRAEEELKRKTTEYLLAEIGKRENRNTEKTGKIRRLATVGAILAVCMVCGVFSYHIYAMPVAYVDIDVNPSVELTLNRFGRVIGTGAYNEEGERVLSEADVGNEDYIEAVGRLLDAMETDGYLGQDSLLCVTVQASESDRASSMLESLRTAIDAASGERHYDFVTEIFTVTEELKICASEHQVSPAKYLAIQDLIAVDSTADFEECKEHSISELRQMTEEHCEEHGEDHAHENEEEDHDVSHETGAEDHDASHETGEEDHDASHETGEGSTHEEKAHETGEGTHEDEAHEAEESAHGNSHDFH